MFANVLVPQDVCKVPDVKVEPAANQKFNSKLDPLLFVNAPVVSPAKVTVLNSHVLVVFTV
jgi:hypothetical protein